MVYKEDMKMAIFKKGNDWGNVQAYGTGEAMSIKKGGYVCKIKGARLEKTKSGADVMVLAFDIAEGEYTGYYDKQFKARRATNSDTKWGGTYRQLIFDKNGNTNPFFKGLITTIEKSNNITLPAEFSDKDIVGKLFGGLFGREEYKKSDGGTSWATKLVAVRDVEVIRTGDFVVPEDKPINNNYYENIGKAQGNAFYETTDEDLPF
jgi:hypothetical protein